MMHIKARTGLKLSLQGGGIIGGDFSTSNLAPVTIPYLKLISAYLSSFWSVCTDGLRQPGFS